MSLLRGLRSPLVYLTKRTISTSLVNSSEKPGDSEGTSEEPRDPKDRSKVIPVETSIRYLKSKAYETTYGDLPVWTHYRRNFKGPYPPETRKTCIKNNRVVSGSPCPICRDEYLVVDYKNVDLIKQFVSPYGGQVLATLKTGVCQRQQQNLLVAIQKAKDYGFLSHFVPHRAYCYRLYNKK